MEPGKLTLDSRLEVLLRAGVWVVTGRDPLPGPPPLPETRASAHQLVLKAVEQKMLPMLAAYLRGTGRDPGESLLDLDTLFRVRMERLYATLDPVLERLQAHGVDLLLLKGGDLAQTVYPADLPRMMEDVDVLVMPTDLLAVERALHEEGFVQGTASSETLTVTPLSPAELAAFRAMNHYELPVYAKFVELPGCAVTAERAGKYLRPHGYWMPVVGTRAYVPVEVDVHFNISRDVDLRDVWNAPHPLKLPGGRSVLGQSATDMLWFLASRLYHEVMQAGGVLLQFIDVLAVVSRRGPEIDWERITEIAAKYGLAPSLYYVLVHVDELLGPAVPSAVLDACCPARRGVRRDHDWGDLMPKLLGGVTTSRIL